MSIFYAVVLENGFTPVAISIVHRNDEDIGRYDLPLYSSTYIHFNYAQKMCFG